MFWPFKKKEIVQEENKQDPEFYSFQPTEDITAHEVAEFLSDIGTWKIMRNDGYIESLPVSQRRHFKKIPIEHINQTKK